MSSGTGWHSITHPRMATGPRQAASEDELSETEALQPAGISEILRHIPHRYPFLLVDRVEAGERNKWVRTVKNVSANDWFFAGIPPHRRIMPEMLVVEALAQAAGVLCHYSGMMSRIGKSIIFFAGIDSCRLERDVVPGDRLLLECEMKRVLRGVAKMSGRATVDGATVVTADLTAVIRHLEPAGDA